MLCRMPSGLLCDFQLVWSKAYCTAEYEKGRSSVMNLRKRLSSKLSLVKMKYMAAGNAIDTIGAMSRIFLQCRWFSVCCSVLCGSGTCVVFMRGKGEIWMKWIY
ncbi:hypothetical protein [Encephalitozoon cuniculi GB-M1]|uniref:Uncharacterized protein n=1 Tax=Encephalitozoon cuniculi (strain GB-M1) TaxID=284813 RepID=Q8SV59_ENCCU|nr:uncharacterized protein ECU06_1660 [Encephalitozoon cuniculi GB-M1]CAD25527.1 hypothetical protein [Encephalitozoon cuniculi GB-M1]